ncbi:hypothetical protein [Legionella longbeachae]|uniref:Uncharacterized protein n=1 Tax=Legionella longbeachae serogroup 1 (strain NSW150) TaxID=661367 RepID=D3HJG8_LEGLN|nr:hypothetical protein [Legionella longbeachae]HBD7399217.1 hypothetical protein [Legionella pneumophila]ARB90681.1 hypothetical protein A6J40_00025 [Legionella longbeachae]ARM32861.1 hypothetical protein B0B39_04730 [Legionella longbeachae]QIN32826.1 hypothetical protein GCB94_12105 [Legionella longbeachae]QIN36131.1 hypothetical protein GCS73_11110 [Legionella longbeachae]
MTEYPANIQAGRTTGNLTDDVVGLGSLKSLAHLKNSFCQQAGLKNTISSNSENYLNRPLIEPGNISEVSLLDHAQSDGTEENDMDLVLSESVNLRP